MALMEHSGWARFLPLLALLLSQVLWADAIKPEDYRIGRDDLLKINVFGHPEFDAQARVSSSGNITFPLLGAINVAGKSTRDIEMQLTKQLARGAYVRNAQVSVFVLEYQSQKVSVMGQVAKPGQYALQASNRVLDLLAMAGGVVTVIAADDATLLRSDGTKTPLDLTALFQGDPVQNPLVAAGDTIYVPRAPQFYIYGEVQRPGVYRLERNMTVSRAISAGGGLTPRGSERRTIIKRRDASGAEKEYSVRTTDLLNADDVLFIKESLF